MGTKHFSAAMQGEMEAQKAAGYTHKEIGENVGLAYWQVKNYFYRKNRREREAKPSKRKGRPRTKPLTKPQEMEVELYKTFFKEAGRK